MGPEASHIVGSSLTALREVPSANDDSSKLRVGMDDLFVHQLGEVHERILRSALWLSARPETCPQHSVLFGCCQLLEPLIVVSEKVPGAVAPIFVFNHHVDEIILAHGSMGFVTLLQQVLEEDTHLYLASL
eukprot:Skav212597  [mRNA]  locus=scaffold2176:14552:14944:+ [translate_table: standard]